MNRCLVSALVAFPKGLRPSEETDVPGGLPLRLDLVSRVPNRHGAVYDTIPVMLEPHTDPAMAVHFPQHDLAALSVLVPAYTFAHAFETSRPLVESVIDALAFQMQVALHVVAFDLVDATEPLTLGEDRDSDTHANSDANIAPKFSTVPMDYTWVEYAAETPSLDLVLFPATTRHQMALWWYVKALDARYAVDKFVALWTAAEILWEDSDVKITEPYTVHACKHVIGSCPECGESVAKLVRGASIKQYLSDRAGVPEADARDMWKVRQVVHGDNFFDPQGLDSLGRLVTILKAAVLTLVKQAIGYPLDPFPFVLNLQPRPPIMDARQRSPGPPASPLPPTAR